MYSLVLLVKGKQNLFVQRGCSSQESFVGGDPRGHADCNCSQPSGSSLFEISCRESLSAPQESVLLLSSMSVWFNSFSYHPSIFPIHLFKDHLVGAFCEWARSWAGAQWWTQESLCSCWAYCHPSPPSPPCHLSHNYRPQARTFRDSEWESVRSGAWEPEGWLTGHEKWSALVGPVLGPSHPHLDIAGSEFLC